MPDDPFLTKLRGGGAAVEDPFLAKVRGGDDPFLAKVRGMPAADPLSALREPDPGTIDVNALPATSPQQSTLGSPGAAGQGWHGITDAEAAQGEKSYMAQMARQAASPFTTAGESIQQAKNADGTVDPALTAGIHTAGSIAFAPAAIATAPLAPVLNWVGEKLDPIARGAAWVAKGMPEGPKHLAPGQRGDMPGEGSQGVQSVRALVNLGAQYLAAKGAGAGIKALRGSPIGEAVKSEFKSVLPTYGRETAPQRVIGNPVQERASAANAENLRRIGQAVDTKYGRATLKPQDVPVPEAAKAEMPKPPVPVVASAPPPAPSDKPIPPAELAALGDEAWQGVEPAPSPAKPAEAPPSPPPASGQAPAGPMARGVHHTSADITEFDPSVRTPGGFTKDTAKPLFGDAVYFFEKGSEPPRQTRFTKTYEADIAGGKILDLTKDVPADEANALIQAALGDKKTTAKKLFGAARVKNTAPVPGEDLYWSVKGGHLTGTNVDVGAVARALGYDGIKFKANEFGNITDTPGRNTRTSYAMFNKEKIGKPAAPSAPDVPAAPPREGPTLGVGLGALGTKPEGWIEAVEKPINAVTRKIGIGKVVDPALNLFKSPEAKISPEFEKAVQEGRATERGLSAEAKRAIKQFEKGTKGVTPEQNVQIGRSLSSEDADLSGLTPEQRAAVEEFRGKAESVRAQEVKAGTLSPEAQAEYGQGHLKRVVKPGMIAERRVARAGGVTIKAYQTAKDMFGIKVDLPAEEVRALVPPDSPLRYLKQEGRSTLLKFTNSPEGMKARDAFYENVKSRFADARSKLSADTTREIKAGDVGQAKQFAKAQADVPRVGDLGVEKFDPIPEDVADRIFVKDTAQRAHVTLQESARRIGKAETLKNIADVVDSKGRVAIEPDGPRAETPEGYTLVDNKNFGPLHRKFVRNDVLEYVKGAFEPQQKHFLTELGDGLMERFKTVRLLDPRMVPRQAISNMEFENLMGMSNWNPRYLQWKAKGLAAMREGSPYRAALERNGFLQSGVVTEAEIGLAENALAEGGSVGKRIGRAIGSLGLTELAPGTLRRAESVGWKAYSYMDAWTKATGYVHAIEELGMSPADAAAYVRKWTPSPESVATWVQGYSKHLVGDPWARYRAEMARINLQALKEKPIRLSMNRLQKNLIRGAAIAAGASLLSDDEEKALKNEQGGGAVALGRDEQGRPLALNYTFLSTLGDFFSQPKTVGKPWDDAKETFLRWSGLGDNPLYSTGSQLLTGENARTGKPINPEGTVEGGLKSFLALAASQWTPSMLSTHLNKLQAAWSDEAYSPNQPKQTKEQAILDVFFGLKLTPLDAQQALQKITRQGGRAYDDIATMFRGQALRGEAIDPEKARDLANMLAKDYSERAEPLNRIATEQAKRTIGAGK